MVIVCSPQIRQYFDSLTAEVTKLHAMANQARAKNLDPEPYVDIPLAASVAQRAEALIASVKPELLNSGLANRIEELEKKAARLTSANRDMYAERQQSLAVIIVDLKVQLKKPGFEDFDDSKRDLKINELKVRSIDSLNDSLNDLMTEITGAKAPKPELDEAAVQPGSLNVTEPAQNNVQDEPPKFNLENLKNIDDHTYALARRLLDATASNNSRK